MILSLIAITATAGLAQPRPVTFIPASVVKAGFDKGATLYAGGGNYRVEASRREKPGMVEIHNRDTDIIYVLDGTTTFVTGGEIIDARTVAPGEIRGTSVAGGDAHHLVKGDVIIVPAGTPHWFREVPAPFIYYVVKVR